MSSAEAGHNSAAEEAASRASVMAFVLMYVMRWLRLVQGEDSNTAPRSKVQILLLTSASGTFADVLDFSRRYPTGFPTSVVMFCNASFYSPSDRGRAFSNAARSGRNGIGSSRRARGMLMPAV